MSPRGSVIVDERTNSLLITETAEKLEEFRRLLNQIDVPVRQVMIEARIVRANDTFDQSIGVRWGGAHVGERTLVGNSIENNITTYNSFVNSGNNNSTPTVTQGLITDLGVGELASSSIAIGFIGSDTLIDLELSALENSGGGEVVSQPKVITGDKEEAVIKSGTEIPFPETSGNGETTISFKEAVLKLEVTPTITPDNRIIMDLVINQDSVGELIIATGLGGQVPTIDTTELITQVLVGNGETIVLGGVYNMSKIKTTSKVPLLGDIPVLGRLFKNTTVSEEKQETLIFITPRILADSLID